MSKNSSRSGKKLSYPSKIDNFEKLKILSDNSILKRVLRNNSMVCILSGALFIAMYIQGGLYTFNDQISLFFGLILIVNGFLILAIKKPLFLLINVILIGLISMYNFYDLISQACKNNISYFGFILSVGIVLYWIGYSVLNYAYYIQYKNIKSVQNISREEKSILNNYINDIKNLDINEPYVINLQIQIIRRKFEDLLELLLNPSLYWKVKFIEGAVILLNIKTKDIFVVNENKFSLEFLGTDKNGLVNLSCKIDKLHCKGKVSSKDYNKFLNWAHSMDR